MVAAIPFLGVAARAAQDSSPPEETLAVPDEVLALVLKLQSSPGWCALDLIESEMEKEPQQEVPLRHLFVKGMYVRECYIPKGTLLVTRIHLTEHPFVISMGAVSVWDEADGVVTLQAPHTGITKPGTRRILFAHSDVIWSTFHVTDETDPDVIVKQVTYSGGKYHELRGAKA